MLDHEGLRARLGELVRARRVDAPPPPPRAADDRRTAVREARGVGVEAFLPGGEWRDAGGAVYVHERLRSDVESRCAHWGRLGVPPAEELDLGRLAAAGLERALFLDLETGGLMSSP